MTDYRKLDSQREGRQHEIGAYRSKSKVNWRW